MTIVNVHEAKTQFSKLLSLVMQGQEVIIAKAGVPTAKLIAFHASKPKRKPGVLKGKIRIASNFDDPLPSDILGEFEGK